MPNYEVTICRIGYGQKAIKLVAASVPEAADQAGDEAGNHLYQENSSAYEITSVRNLDTGKFEFFPAEVDACNTLGYAKHLLAKLLEVAAPGATSAADCDVVKATEAWLSAHAENWMPTVVTQVTGGVLTGFTANVPVQHIGVDYDVNGCDESDLSTDPDGEKCTAGTSLAAVDASMVARFIATTGD